MTEETNYENEIGKVSWFNKRSGYGFIKIISDSSIKDKEIFCHYSNIDSDNDYKHLIPGECVSLKVRYIPSNEENKQYSCENVTGLLGTKLLFENEDYTYKFYRKKNE